MIKLMWSFIWIAAMFFLVGGLTLVLFIGSTLLAFLYATFLFVLLGLLALTVAMIAFLVESWMQQ